MIDHEVAHPDRADLPLREQRLERPVRLQRRVELRGQCLVQDQQVDLINSELAGALLKTVQRLVVAVVTDPDLGLQEHLGPVQPRAVHGFPDLPLVTVGSGGVDVAIARFQRGRHGGPSFIRRGLEHTQSEGGHDDAVVQRQRGDIRHGISSSFLSGGPESIPSH